MVVMQAGVQIGEAEPNQWLLAGGTVLIIIALSFLIAGVKGLFEGDPIFLFIALVVPAIIIFGMFGLMLLSSADDNSQDKVHAQAIADLEAKYDLEFRNEVKIPVRPDAPARDKGAVDFAADDDTFYETTFTTSVFDKRAKAVYPEAMIERKGNVIDVLVPDKDDPTQYVPLDPEPRSADQ